MLPLINCEHLMWNNSWFTMDAKEKFKVSFQIKKIEKKILLKIVFAKKNCFWNERRSQTPNHMRPWRSKITFLLAKLVAIIDILYWTCHYSLIFLSQLWEISCRKNSRMASLSMAASKGEMKCAVKYELSNFWVQVLLSSMRIIVFGHGRKSTKYPSGTKGVSSKNSALHQHHRVFLGTDCLG